MESKTMEIIIIILGILIVGSVILLLPPALYDRTKALYLDYMAKPEPVLNVIKVQKIDLYKNYSGGGNFFNTVDGKGRVIHLSPTFSKELYEKNLTAGFFDIPSNCVGCINYMFHLKNTNNKTIKNIEIKFKIQGKIAEPGIKLVHQEEKDIANYKCENNLCEMNILNISSRKTLSFGIFVSEPGNLLEVACEIAGGGCDINHYDMFYGDIKFGSGNVFLNYNGKKYSFPEINNSQEKQNYQLINGVWTKYE